MIGRKAQKTVSDIPAKVIGKVDELKGVVRRGAAAQLSITLRCDGCHAGGGAIRSTLSA